MNASRWIAAALVLVADSASAQATWAYRGRLALETVMQQANTSSPLVPGGQPAWDAAALLVAAGDGSWQPSARIRLAGGGLLTVTDGRAAVRAREAYGRLSVNSWMDLEAGKRLVRWGVGYGFSPTGVLDPPRVATDPSDRLGRNEGITLVRADVFRGPASLTVAAAAPPAARQESPGSRRLIAARLRTVVRGVELALVGTAAPHARAAFGASVTHVLGQQLEWHAEVLVHDRAPGGDRTLSGVAGLQYTFAAGVNLVVEYHRDGRGLSGAQWAAIMRGEPAPAGRIARRQALFVRAARANGERRIVPELIVIANLDDGGWTVVPAITWAANDRLQLLVRATHLAGGPRSIAAFAPWSTALTFGASARF